MKEHPILFNSEMVGAILDGRKTQTRRVVKPQPDFCISTATYQNSLEEIKKSIIARCSFGKVGDRLWVRETFRIPEDYEYYERGTVLYAASEMDAGAKWKPSIHMPRWASRITLEITDIRTERINEISAMDCISEGIKRSESNNVEARVDDEILAFKTLWNSISKKHTWESNPYVWVIEFKAMK